MLSAIALCLALQVNDPIPVGLEDNNNGRFRTTYTLGTTKKVNVTVLSAGYTAAPFVQGDSYTLPNNGGKLLVIKMRLDNPNNTDFVFSETVNQGVKTSIITSESLKISTLAKYAAGSGKYMSNFTLTAGKSTEILNVVEIDAESRANTLILSPGDGGKGGSVNIDLVQNIAELPEWARGENSAALNKEVTATAPLLYPINLHWVGVSGFTRIAPNTDVPVLGKSSRGWIIVHMQIRGGEKQIRPAGFWLSEPRLRMNNGQSYPPKDGLRLQDNTLLNDMPTLNAVGRLKLAFEVPASEEPSNLNLRDASFRRNYSFPLQFLPSGPSVLTLKKADHLSP